MNGIFDLTGSVALITGATRGLGQARAVALAEFGADIAIVQRNTEDTATLDMIKKLDKRCEIVKCDLDDMKQVRDIIRYSDQIIRVCRYTCKQCWYTTKIPSGCVF